MNRLFKRPAGFNSKIIIVVVAIAAAVAIFFGLRAEKKEPIKIGAILSISGPGSHVGEEVRNGLLLAVDEINSWGGINGRKLALIIGDSETNPQQGQEVLKKIEQAHHPLLYVSDLGAVSMALVSLSGENRVVITGLVVTAPKFTAQNEWIFRYWPTAKAEIEPILHILQALDIKKLGLLYVNNVFGRSVYGLLKKGFERPGRMVRGESFDLKGANLRQRMEKLNDTEGIYIVGYPVHTMNAIKMLRGAGFGGFILSTQGGVIPEIISLPEANGLYAAAPIIYNPNYLFAKEAKEKYKARYTKPFNHFAANGYDFIKLLASLLEDKTISRKGVKSLLEGGFIYHGVFGDLDVEPGKHDIIFPLHPARIVDGEVKYLHRIFSIED
ncbi:MAG: ABC transporter substrate-binding protein [Pseudomonadota bacterium]